MKWLQSLWPFRRRRDRLKTAAEYVVAELLACIDIQQCWEGWAHKYRDHFRYDPEAFDTLGDALDVLRDEISGPPDPRDVARRKIDEIESKMEALRDKATGTERIALTNDLGYLRTMRTLKGI